MYDKSSAIDLISNASVVQKTGDYRVTTYDLKDPVKLPTFGEFIGSLLDKG